MNRSVEMSINGYPSWRRRHQLNSALSVHDAVSASVRVPIVESFSVVPLSTPDPADRDVELPVFVELDPLVRRFDRVEDVDDDEVDDVDDEDRREDRRFEFELDDEDRRPDDEVCDDVDRRPDDEEDRPDDEEDRPDDDRSRLDRDEVPEPDDEPPLRRLLERPALELDVLLLALTDRSLVLEERLPLLPPSSVRHALGSGIPDVRFAT
jgi:hypothetical protein